MTDERDMKIAAALGALPVPEHGPEFWANVEAAVDARSPVRRVRVLQLAAAFVAVGLAAAAIVFLRGGDSGREVVTQPDETTVPVGGAPETFVGVVDGRIATFSAATGQRLQFLTSDAYSDYTEPRSVGESVYFLRHALPNGRPNESAPPDIECNGAVVKVDPAHAGSESVVASGTDHLSNLAVSADGTMVAWASVPCGNGEATIRILNTRTGAQRSISMGNPPAAYGKPSWSRDDRHLALMARGGGGGSYGVVFLDTTAARSLDYGHLGLDSCYQESPSFLDDGSLVVLTCAASKNFESVAAIRFDAQGNELGKVFDVTTNDYSLGVDGVTSFSLTGDGKHAIYQVRSSHGGVSTYRWDGDAVHELHTDALDLAW